MVGQERDKASHKDNDSFDDIEARLDRLGGKLDKVRSETEDNANVTRSIAQSHNQMGTAFRITSELIGPVLVSTFIGYWLDQYFATKPILMILFFVLGVVTGFVNVVRAAKKMQQEMIDSGAYKEAKDMPYDDDDK